MELSLPLLSFYSSIHICFYCPTDADALLTYSFFLKKELFGYPYEPDPIQPDECIYGSSLAPIGINVQIQIQI
jgi:hypothetical protein